MKKQRYIVEIEMPDGDFISAGWLKDIIQTDCDVEDESRKKVTVQETSLPSNLNKAAMQFAQRAYSPFDDPYEVSKAFENDVNCFKAGAKWMAEQGYTQEGIAHLDDHEVWVDIKNTDIKDGDKVIVQIRKK